MLNKRRGSFEISGIARMTLSFSGMHPVSGNSVFFKSDANSRVSFAARWIEVCASLTITDSACLSFSCSEMHPMSGTWGLQILWTISCSLLV